MSGFVYFLTNTAMPNLVKIGYTKGLVEERLAQLNTTGVPAPFSVLASFRIDNAERTEKLIHGELHQYRYSVNREFFEISQRQALELSAPVIFDALSSNVVLDDIDVISLESSHGLDDETVSILQSMADNNRNSGYFIDTLKEMTGESAIETEYRLSVLKEMGLVQEKQTRDDWRGSIWKLTSKGVKFIFENALFEDYMKDVW